MAAKMSTTLVVEEIRRLESESGQPKALSAYIESLAITSHTDRVIIETAIDSLLSNGHLVQAKILLGLIEDDVQAGSLDDEHIACARLLNAKCVSTAYAGHTGAHKASEAVSKVYADSSGLYLGHCLASLMQACADLYGLGAFRAGLGNAPCTERISWPS